MNLTMLLDMAADGFGERVVVGRRATGFTAADLHRFSASGARWLRDQNASALVYLDSNGPAFPTALFAAARAGVPLVPLNYRLGTDQLAELLARHPGAVAIAPRALAPLLGKAGLPSCPADDWIAKVRESARFAAPDQGAAETERPAVIIYTSGTTSAPKGVLLRHANLVSYVLGSVEFAGADRDDTSLVSVPPYHIAAVANAITNLYAGRRCIVLEQFAGGDWLDLVRGEGVTHALVVPTMLAKIMASGGDMSVPTLRSLAYGGAAMPVAIIRQALAAWPHVDFVNAYGLTETSSTISVLGPDVHRAAQTSPDPAMRARLGSAGRPLPSVEVQIRHRDGAVCGPGQVGRIWVRGEQVSGEYAGTGPVLDEHGYFDTRDEGFLDEAGYLFVGGRADDTIIRGGENIAPAEIEDILLTHEDVADAAVVGIPDEVWGQRLEAVVVAREGATLDPDGIREHVRRHLRGSKTPERVVVWDELPRNDVGKLVRRHVVERMLQGELSPADGRHHP